MSSENLNQRIKKLKLELNECLAQAQKTKDGRISSALQNCAEALNPLLDSLEGKSESFPSDFWAGESSESKVNHIIDRIITRVSNLKLPSISGSVKLKRS